MEVYVLYLEMYHEWACENGACDLIGLYSSKEKVLDRLKELLLGEEQEQHIVGMQDSITDYINGIKENGSISTPIYIDIYENLENYKNGVANGCYVIRKEKVK